MSSSAGVRTRSNLYWKPEQPPPSTLTRSARAAASPATISAMRLAARSVTVTGSLIDGLGLAPDRATCGADGIYPYAR